MLIRHRYQFLVESIACVDGKLLSLDYHQKRMDSTFKALFDSSPSFSLKKIAVPSHAQKGLYKCKVVYQKKQIESITFTPYLAKKNLYFALVDAKNLSYSFKWENRKKIDTLLALARKDYFAVDDIILVKKNLVTDSSYGNIVFKRKNLWFTPSNPLLKGTYREQLINQKKIFPLSIGISKKVKNYDLLLNQFESFKIINALLRYNGEEISTKRIYNLSNYK